MSASSADREIRMTFRGPSRVPASWPVSTSVRTSRTPTRRTLAASRDVSTAGSCSKSTDTTLDRSSMDLRWFDWRVVGFFMIPFSQPGAQPLPAAATRTGRITGAATWRRTHDELDRRSDIAKRRHCPFVSDRSVLRRGPQAFLGADALSHAVRVAERVLRVAAASTVPAGARGRAAGYVGGVVPP